MIRKLRRKFVVTMMVIVLAFLLLILTGLYFSSMKGFESRSFEAMTFAMTRHNDRMIDRMDERMNDRRRPLSNGMSLIVATISQVGEVSILENRVSYLTDEEAAVLARDTLLKDGAFGSLDGYNLRYHRALQPDGLQRVVLADTSLERDALQVQLATSLLIGLLTAGLFFIAALFLSNWMVHPLEEAWNKQRQFVADASHELKTPLTVVLSNTDMLIASNSVTTDKNVRRLDNIRAESQRMKGLVEDLLTLARTDSNKAQTVFSRVSMSYVAECALLTIEPAIFDAGRTLDYAIAPDLNVCGDESKLRQLLDILLDNACKYSEDASCIQVVLEYGRKKELRLAVTSHGSPIPPEEREAIFRRFYRSDKSRSEETGYGLGLSIAQGIVNAHDGKIGVECTAPSSNTFYVTLPIYKEKDTLSERNTLRLFKKVRKS